MTAQVKRYFVFAYNYERPEGGLNDYMGESDSFDTAKEIAEHHADYDYVEIHDMETGEVFAK